MRNGIGISLLKQHGDKTHNLRPVITFIPTITYDDFYNVTLQNDSLWSFQDTVTDLIDKSTASCRLMY